VGELELNNLFKRLFPDFANTKISLKWISEEQYNYVEKHFHNLKCDVNAFISYSSKDKEIAGIIKQAFKNLGITAFLAHEDIVPSKEWQEEIIKRLRVTNIFVPVLTDNFKQSDWTDQESGAAFIRDIEIIPISINTTDGSYVNPYGFIGKYQTLKYTVDSTTLKLNRAKIVDGIQTELSKTLQTKTKILKNIRNCFVNALVNSLNYADANATSDAVKFFKPFSKKQLKMIVFGYVFNSQVNGAGSASSVVYRLIEDNLAHLDSITKSIYKKNR
jgi:hypothetical protein